MTTRARIVFLHRYVGLVMAGFLMVAGLTGSLLAWNDELEAAISPDLLRVAPPAPDAPLLDPLALRARVAERYPNAWVMVAPLKVEASHTVSFFLKARPDPATGQAAELPNDQVFVNPYTGTVLGERKSGEITQGMKNLMPFIYRLHFSLALGTVGSYLMGIVALLWTVGLFCWRDPHLSGAAAQKATPPHLNPLLASGERGHGSESLPC